MDWGLGLHNRSAAASGASSGTHHGDGGASGSTDELPAWAARRGGSREAALATAVPLHEDPLVTHPRFAPSSGSGGVNEDGEISVAAAAPPAAAKVLRRLRDSSNLRFRHLSGARSSRDAGGQVEVAAAVFLGLVFLLAYFRPWPLS